MPRIETRHDRGRSAARGRRRGSALYLTVVAVSIVVAGLGWSVVATQRADRRVQNNLIAENKATWCARAGMEMAFLYFEKVANWRQQVGAGSTLFTAVPVGSGVCDVQVFDDSDNNVADDDSEPVRIVATGRVSGATARLQARLMPRPHACLRYAVFNPTNQNTEFRSNAIVKGPVRAHGNITSAATVQHMGDASFETMAGYTIQDPLAPKYFASTAISAPNVNLSIYQSAATAITVGGLWTCQMKGCNLTPTFSPFGAPNPNGIYSLDAGGREVLIENVHIRGTLIITNTGGNRVRFQGGVWIEPGPLNYPVLMIDTAGTGNVEIALDSSTLIERFIQLNIAGINIGLGGVDFNENGTKDDTLSCYVRGIVWANAAVVDLQTNAWSFTGCLVNRHPIVDNAVSVNNDPALQTLVIPGFVDSGMHVIAGTYKETQ